MARTLPTWKGRIVCRERIFRKRELRRASAFAEVCQYIEMASRRRQAPGTSEQPRRRRQDLDFSEVPASKKVKASDPDAIKVSHPNEFDIKVVYTKNTKTGEHTTTGAFCFNEAGNEPPQVKAMRKEELEKHMGGEAVTK